MFDEFVVLEFLFPAFEKFQFKRKSGKKVKSVSSSMASLVIFCETKHENFRLDNYAIIA